MAKTQKISEQEKADMEKMQQRVESMLPPKTDIPAAISIQQAEELKSRIIDLEEQLAQKQAEAAQKKNAPLTDAKIVELNILSNAVSSIPERVTWLSKIWDWLVEAHPSITDIGERRSARLASSFLFVIALLEFVGVLARLPRVGLLGAFSGPLGISLIPTLFAYLISRTKRYPAAIFIFALTFGSLAYISILSEGAQADFGTLILIYVPLSLIVASTFLSSWAVFLLTGLNIGAYLLVFKTGNFNSPDNLVAQVGIVNTIGIVLILLSNFRNRNEQLRLNEFKEVNLQLDNAKKNLEQRVADRTHDLELAAEVGRTIAEKVENISIMLTDATEMIRSRFNLYYTQVYLLDPSGQTITLRAGTGSAGKQLLQRGHHLLVSSSSLNGRAVAEKNPVIVADTEKSDTFLANPLLPKTRSEMAIPLLIGDKVLGVLDMQSEFANALNEDNVAAFQVLAGQLSVAIQNATLFAQSEEARKQVEENVQQITTAGWADYLNGIDRGEKIGYVFDQNEVKPLERKGKSKSGNALNFPIKVTGATVGSIQVAQDEREWTLSESQLVQSTAEQLAQHIENLRLLSQAEKYRLEAEQTTRQLTREGWDVYLQTRSVLAEGYSFNPNEVKLEHDAMELEMPSTLSLPITVRDESIGEFKINAHNVDHQAVDEIFSAVVSQLGDHIENLRLSEQNEKRAYELATVATVSTTAATVLDPDKLLQAVVDLTKERFNVYHTHIYLADDSWNTLLLAAGAGEVGRQMVDTGHAIQMDAERSLVARASRERQSIIVNDVRSEAGFLPNPMLPETRSEMAVPMIAGDKVIGVFDVQANDVGHFTDEDANIYTTLASQVAIALQNARLYVEQAATVTQLRELDRLKSSFLANMSHELRTPLNSILGFADVMLEGLDGPLTDYMTNDLGLIQKNGQHLLHLINDVLDMAKIDSGKMNLNVEKFNVHELLTDVISITSSLAKEKSLALIIEPDTDYEVEINADKIRLRQVMINLVNNAMKFTEKGNVTMRVTHENNNVLISVKDTGIGIPLDHLEAVFQEFTQVDTTTTRKAGGTGLGLPISRRLINMHSGRLWAESTGVNGEGSTFYVYLPIEANINENATLTAK